MVTRKPDRWRKVPFKCSSLAVSCTGLASKDKVTTVYIGGLGSEKPRKRGN